MPDTWKIYSDEKGFFHREKSTNRKRYGVVRNCLHCEREFLARNSWNDTAFTCSRFCNTTSRQKRIKVSCAWCDNEIEKTQSYLNNSKHGLHFCNRKCKENAQSIGGIEEIQPPHYKDGTKAYSVRALNHYGCKCVDCKCPGCKCLK